MRRLALLLLTCTSCQLITDFEPVPEGLAQCSDTLDNDDDGAIDCADDGCARAAACTPACGNGVIDPPRFAFAPTELDVAAPIGLVVARISPDSTPDVVVATQGGALIELRSSGGTLIPQPAVTVARATFTAVAAGFLGGSGGGPDDVLATDTMLDQLVTAPNSGAGLAEAFRGETLGADPIAIVTGDLDTDGDIDAIIASAGAGPTYLRNLSGDGFSPSAPQVPERPSALAAADLDGDQRTDLVLAVGAGDHLIVLTQQAGSTTAFPFAAGPAIAVGDNPVAVIVANVDGAGRPDLVVANAGSNDLTVLLAAAGGYGAAPRVALAARPLSLVAADLDGDGDVDLAVGLAGAHVAIYAGDGGGGFTLASTITVDGDSAALVALRVDGDPLPDLVTAEPAANRVTLLSNGTVRETCDDGNTSDGDTCPADCTQP